MHNEEGVSHQHPLKAFVKFDELTVARLNLPDEVCLNQDEYL